jgi:hypothetical protein
MSVKRTPISGRASISASASSAPRRHQRLVTQLSNDGLCQNPQLFFVVDDQNDSHGPLPYTVRQRTNGAVRRWFPNYLYFRANRLTPGCTGP